MTRRRFLVPEVIQTSAMDCGPAALQSLCAGFGREISYGRLREACQTEVDGTSIDMLEQVARQLGLDAEQVMLPLDHVLLGEAAALPALVVVRTPGGFTHFLIAWARVGRFVQVMDPSSGRRWLTQDQFLRDLYVHEMEVPASGWLAWAQSEDFLRALRRRMADLGMTRDPGKLIEVACAAGNWRPLATLDAAVRLVAAQVRASGLRTGREAAEAVRALVGSAGRAEHGRNLIPTSYWTVRPGGGGPVSGQAAADETLVLRGAVLLRVRGVRAEAAAFGGKQAEAQAAAAPLGPELLAALEDPPIRAARTLWRLIRVEGRAALAAMLLATAIAGAVVVLEVLLLRGALDIGRSLGLVTQRLTAIGAFAALVMVLLLLELRASLGLMRLGRGLEARLRVALLDKLSRLPDRYFRSRPVSDMAERAHAAYQIRGLPALAGHFIGTIATLAVTGGAIAWFDPPNAGLAGAAVLFALLVPLAGSRHLAERDLRARTHDGALGRFYLDALLGLTALRAHCAAPAVRAEHEGLLAAWAGASLRTVRSAVALNGLQSVAGVAFAAILLARHTGPVSDPAAALLLVWWALQLPTLGSEVVQIVREFGLQRNLVLRLLEPVQAHEEPSATHSGRNAHADHDDPAAPGRALGAAVEFDDVTVRAGGHVLLESIRGRIEPGAHVAIVGSSGAGKSTLVGLLLGWHRPASGQVRVDGRPLDGRELEQLRRVTVWIDPAVQLWNRSLLDNLDYGNGHCEADRIADALAACELHELVERLPSGLQTALGEGGGLLSGGEGQRVRTGRGLLRATTRLVILDEPFRGLERERRARLLAAVRMRWPHATVLCIAHDVRATLDFPRVLVLRAGHLVEDGPPAVLAADPASDYRALLDAEQVVESEIWGDSRWRRVQVGDGRLREEAQIR